MATYANITRRRALTSIAAAGAALVPANAIASPAPCRWSRAYELGVELSRIVSELASDKSLMVKVYPKEAPGVEGDPVRFCRVDRADLIELRTLIEAHYTAMQEYELCSDEDWDRRREVINANINASREALLTHRPRSLTEVRMKASFMARDKAFGHWDDIEAQRIIRSLTPA